METRKRGAARWRRPAMVLIVHPSSTRGFLGGSQPRRSCQADPQHTPDIPYRCYLPVLAGLGGRHCAGPGYQHVAAGPYPTTRRLGRELCPAKADCGYRVPLAPRLARSNRQTLDPSILTDMAIIVESVKVVECVYGFCSKCRCCLDAGGEQASCSDQTHHRNSYPPACHGSSTALSPEHETGTLRPQPDTVSCTRNETRTQKN